jgi:CxxC motif-containing protein
MMKEVKDLICITCPKGCEAKVWSDDGGIKVKGKICKKGKAYLAQEFRAPMRILTTTVVVASGSSRRLPVRTAKALPKKYLFKAMAQIGRVSVKPPVRIGDVILSDLAGSGVDLIAADDLFH